MSESRFGRAGWLAFALAAAACAAFANSFAGVFLFDDFADIVFNPAIRHLVPPLSGGEAMTSSGLAGRPVVAFTFAANYAISELQTWSYHATNLAIHVGATLCLFGVVRTLCALPRATLWMRERRELLAFGTALLWSVHPLQTCAVTFIVQRCESLMGLCFLAGLWAALARMQRERSPALAPPQRERSIGLVALAALCVVLGAGAKETIALLPVVAFVLDWTFVSGSPTAAWRAHRELYVALLASTVCVALSIASGGVQRVTADAIVDDVTWRAWLTSQPPAIVEYFRLVFVPAPILIDYGWPIPRELGAWLPQACLVGALLAATTLACVRAPRVGAVAALGLVLLAPASSVVPLPLELWALHRMYLPLACVAALCVALVLGVTARAPRWVPVGALLVLAAASAWQTTRVNATFSNAERYWRATLEHLPDQARAWVNLGDEYEATQRIELARDAYRRAVALRPNHALWFNNLARFEAQLGDLDRAIELWERALALLPVATIERDNLVRAHVRRARELVALGKLDLAVHAFDRAITVLGEDGPADMRASVAREAAEVRAQAAGSGAQH